MTKKIRRNYPPHNPNGKPKTPFSLTQDEQKVIEEMYKNGCCDAEIVQYIRELKGTCSKDLFNRWIAEVPVFSTLINEGREAAHAWWMRVGRTNLVNKKFSVQLYHLNMLNRFRHKDWKGS